jgi:hypothetical protein
MSIETTALRDAILIEFVPTEQNDRAISIALGEFLRELEIAPGDYAGFLAMDEPRVTVYLRDKAIDLGLVTQRAGAQFGALTKGDVEVSRLSAVRTYAGASADMVAPYHYVVRTDVAMGSERELERWYDEEHMQALANVPGVVRAERFVSLDASPRYYACYDLVSPDVRQSPQWLAVRETDWSGRVRPMFRQTRRIVSRRLALGD